MPIANISIIYEHLSFWNILPPSSFISHAGTWHGLLNNTFTIYLSDLLLINRLRICLSVNRRCEPLGYERTHVITSGVMGPKSGPPFIFFRPRLFSYRVSLAIGHSSHFGSLLQFSLQAAGGGRRGPLLPNQHEHRAVPPTSSGHLCRPLKSPRPRPAFCSSLHCAQPSLLPPSSCAAP